MGRAETNRADTDTMEADHMETDHMEQIAIKAADLIETYPKRAVFVLAAWSMLCLVIGQALA